MPRQLIERSRAAIRSTVSNRDFVAWPPPVKLSYRNLKFATEFDLGPHADNAGYQDLANPLKTADNCVLDSRTCQRFKYKDLSNENRSTNLG
jgi:hypothetical protein